MGGFLYQNKQEHKGSPRSASTFRFRFRIQEHKAIPPRLQALDVILRGSGFSKLVSVRFFGLLDASVIDKLKATYVFSRSTEN